MDEFDRVAVRLQDAGHRHQSVVDPRRAVDVWVDEDDAHGGVRGGRSLDTPARGVILPSYRRLSRGGPIAPGVG